MPHTLHPDHLLPNKKDRIRKPKNCGEKYLADMFNKVDDVLDEAFVDYTNGASRGDVVQKLMRGLYPSQKGKEMPYRSANLYFNTVLGRMAYNTDIELNNLRNVFYNRYEALFEEAVKTGDTGQARQVLTDMAKIFGIQKEKPDTAIQINSESDGHVTINFGFSGEKDDE